MASASANRGEFASHDCRAPSSRRGKEGKRGWNAPIFLTKEGVDRTEPNSSLKGLWLHAGQEREKERVRNWRSHLPCTEEKRVRHHIVDDIVKFICSPSLPPEKQKKKKGKASLGESFLQRNSRNTQWGGGKRKKAASAIRRHLERGGGGNEAFTVSGKRLTSHFATFELQGREERATKGKDGAP